MTRIEMMKPDDVLPSLNFKCDHVQLFLYNAVLWNAHRIHFDYPYATETEGYTDLVVAGPLMGDWLTQCLNKWAADDASLVSFSYSNRKIAYVNEPLHTTGKVLDINLDTNMVQVEIEIRNVEDEVVTPGKASLHFPVK